MGVICRERKSVGKKMNENCVVGSITMTRRGRNRHVSGW